MNRLLTITDVAKSHSAEDEAEELPEEEEDDYQLDAI